MAGLWGKRKREQEAAVAAADADLARRAEQALVGADERIRVTTDELAFAEAELGSDATAPLREALTAVRTHLQEAFQLHQLNHDEIPDTAEEFRTRIAQLCEWAESLLDERTSALEERIARVRRAPEVLAQVRRDADALAPSVPHARTTIERLAARYSPEALRQVGAGAEEVDQLLTFAAHSAYVSERRRAAGRNEEANLALETATEAVRRAQTMLDGIEDFEIEALRAELTPGDVIADSRGDLVVARNAPRTPAVTQAAADLEAALAALPAPGVKADPFAALSRLTLPRHGGELGRVSPVPVDPGDDASAPFDELGVTQPIGVTDLDKGGPA
ncbi:hypothetical protein [Microbacterium lacticum]